MIRDFSRKYKIINQGVSIALVLVFSFVIISQAALASEITSGTVIKLVNDARRSSGIPELKENKKLDEIANDKVHDMITYKYFSHNSPSGVTPWNWFEKNNYDYKYAGENLAMDFYSAEKQQQAWMDSPTHRKNILNPAYLEIGVAVAQGMINDHIATITVQMFGTQDTSGATVKTSTQTGAPVKTEGEFKILDGGLISSNYKPLIAGITLQKIGNSNLTEINLEVPRNDFVKISDLTYKMSGESWNMLFGQAAGVGNYGVFEIAIWLIMVLILSFAAISNAKVLAKYNRRNSIPASGIIVFLAILTTAMFCGFIFR